MIQKKELRRQLFHILFGLIIVILIFFSILNKITFTLLLIAAVVICIVSRRRKIPGIYWFFKTFERDIETIHFPGKGALFFLIGSYIVLMLFPKDIAMASITILTFGDAISHIVGCYGSMKNPLCRKKYLEGFIAGFITSFIFSYPILHNVLEAAIASFVGMVAESIEIGKQDRRVDDNLVMPLAAAVSIWVVRFIVGLVG